MNTVMVKKNGISYPQRLPKSQKRDSFYRGYGKASFGDKVYKGL